MGHTLQIPSQLSSHLRALRKARGLSQASLGQRLALSQTRIARIEANPLSISVDQLLAVLTALGVRVTLDPLPTTAPATAPVTRRTAATPLRARPAGARHSVGKAAVPPANAEPDW